MEEHASSTNLRFNFDKFDLHEMSYPISEIQYYFE